MPLIEIDTNPPEGTLRWFAGLWFPLFCGVAGAMLHFKLGHPTAAWVLWSIGAIVAIVGLIQPRAVRWIFVGWMYAAFPIGWTVSHLVLGFTYFVVMTGIGLVMRALGKDPMERKFQKDAPTYWVEHRPGGDRKRYFRQF